jgi:hypothetical protein
MTSQNSGVTRYAASCSASPSPVIVTLTWLNEPSDSKTSVRLLLPVRSQPTGRAHRAVVARTLVPDDPDDARCIREWQRFQQHRVDDGEKRPIEAIASASVTIATTANPGVRTSERRARDKLDMAGCRRRRLPVGCSVVAIWFTETFPSRAKWPLERVQTDHRGGLRYYHVVRGSRR